MVWSISFEHLRLPGRARKVQVLPPGTPSGPKFALLAGSSLGVRSRPQNKGHEQHEGHEQYKRREQQEKRVQHGWGVNKNKRNLQKNH